MPRRDEGPHLDGWRSADIGSIVDLLGNDSFRAGVLAGALAAVVVAVVALVAGGGPRRHPWAGAVFAAAAVVALDRQGMLDPDVGPGLVALGLGGLCGALLAQISDGAARLRPVLDALLALPGAVLVASAAREAETADFGGLGWAPVAVFAVTVAGSALLPDFDRAACRSPDGLHGPGGSGDPGGPGGSRGPGGLGGPGGPRGPGGLGGSGGPGGSRGPGGLGGSGGSRGPGGLGGLRALWLPGRGSPAGGLPPVLLAVTVFGVWVTVPETQHAVALMGAAVPVALLGWPKPLASIGGPGAFMLTGLLTWTVAVDGAARPGSVVGGLSCLGLLVLEPAVRRSAWLARPVRRVAGPDDVGRTALAVVALHVALVVACSRVAGLQTSAWIASALVAVAYAASALVLVRLPALGGDEDRTATGPRGARVPARGA